MTGRRIAGSPNNLVDPVQIRDGRKFNFVFAGRAPFQALARLRRPSRLATGRRLRLSRRIFLSLGLSSLRQIAANSQMPFELVVVGSENRILRERRFEMGPPFRAGIFASRDHLFAGDIATEASASHNARNNLPLRTQRDFAGQGAACERIL